MKRIYKVMLFLVIVLILTSCGTTAKFVYPDNMRQLTKVSTTPVYDTTVIAVLPFDDNTDNINDSGCIPLAMVPLFPFGWCNYSRPEASEYFATIKVFSCTPSEDLAKALALSLRNSNLVRDAYFSYGGDKDNANIIVTGTINDFYYRGKLITYGLSCFGSYLWFLGAPCGTSYNYVNITLQAKKPNSTKILWEYNFSGNGGYWQGLYYNFGYDIKDFSKIVQQGYNSAIVDLQRKMLENPETFK